MSNFSLVHLLKRFDLIIKKIMGTYLISLRAIVILTYFFRPYRFGQIKVVDADTIVFNEEKIRPYGIDAPETNQYCYLNRAAWPCGKQAAKYFKIY